MESITFNIPGKLVEITEVGPSSLLRLSSSRHCLAGIGHTPAVLCFDSSGRLGPKAHGGIYTVVTLSLWRHSVIEAK